MSTGSPPDVDAIQAALRHLAAGEVDHALVLLDQALAADPRARSGAAAARVVRGLIHLDRGAFPEALADFRAHLDTVPDDPAGWLGLGRAHAGLQAFPLALPAFDRALELRPAWGDAHWHRASSRAATQDLGGAVEDLDQALRHLAAHARGSGREARICYTRAQLRLMADDKDGARGDFIRAAAIWDSRGDVAARDRVIAVAKALGL